MDSLDDIFDELAPVPAIKLMPEGLLYYCAMGQHQRCHGYGWINPGTDKTNSNAGERLKVRCSCPCPHN